MHNNVLPPEVKQDLRKEYRLRFATVGVFALAAVASLLFFSLLPAFIAVSSKESQVETETLAIQKLKQNDSATQVVKELTATKQKIEALGVKGPSQSGSAIVQKAVNAIPTGISLQSILYQPMGTGHDLIITGVAATRDALLSFQTNLEHATPFEQANIPVEELAKSVNVNFTITVTGDF